MSLKVPCPVCGGPTWDNRGRKKRDNEPDFRCKDKVNCPGKIQHYQGGEGTPAEKPVLTEEQKAELRKSIANRLGAATQFVTTHCTPQLKQACGADGAALTQATQALVSTLMIEWGRQGAL